MIEFIPAIDIIDGKCVRLSQGDFARKTIYSNNPLDVARAFEDQGCKRLHLVDLDGARQGSIVNIPTLEAIAKGTQLRVDFGGGIKTDADIRSVFDAGAAIASIGSIAVKQPVLFHRWISEYGAEKIWLGADVRHLKILINGWQEGTELDIFDFVEMNTNAGVQYIFCTDVSKDGMLEGASVALYTAILERFPELQLIASGGVSSMADIAALDAVGCAGVIVGKAFYEGRISLEDIKKHNS
jgi:phosphoribosylformimino-5-aminoimidazole carboxamide ribotide isomerase